MKKNVILFFSFVLTISLSAQISDVKEKPTDKRMWFDLQIAQHFGLNPWGTAYLHDGLPKAMITEFKGVFNIYLARPYLGVYADMGIGFMPAPKMQSLDLEQLPMPHNGAKYYLREVLSESGNTGTTAHFKMTFGLFGKIPVYEKLSVMPYLGLGFLTMPQRECEIILKEQGSNLQYRTLYVWNCKNGNENSYDGATHPGYLVGKLNFKYKFSQRSSLLFGLEYTYFLQTLDFFGRYTNTFNANIQRNFNVKGEKMNMIGISVGLSFM